MELLVEALWSGVTVEVNEVESATVDILVLSFLSGLSFFFLASVENVVF